MKTLKELLERKKQINEQLTDEKRSAELSIDDLKGLETELREINNDIEELEMRERLAKESAALEDGTAEARTVETFNNGGLNNNVGIEERSFESIANDLLENRSVTVGSGDLVLPKHTSTDIKGTFNQVSTLIDAVKSVPLDGGETYESPYEIQHGEGNYTNEGEPYHDVDHEFGYSTINKTKVTAYTEITEEVEKLPKAQYAQRVIDGVKKSINKKIAGQIMTGKGATSKEITGIFSEGAKAINPATDMEISKIDEDTLDEIIFAFGGEENVEGHFYLILSKDTLREFTKVRYPDGRKVYDVKHNGNTGAIDSVPYIINSAAKSIQRAEQGDYIMAYGPLVNYELATFSPIDIKRSDDYKFREGLTAYRGSVFVGGNVVSHNGFLRIKKSAGTDTP